MPVVRLIQGGQSSSLAPESAASVSSAPAPVESTKPDPYGLPATFPHDLAWRGVLKLWRDAVGPGTESADEFHFGSAIAAIGSLIGRHFCFKYPYPHYCNFFVCLVGPTGKARKTAAMNLAIDDLLRPIAQRSINAGSFGTSEGLSGSGEGLLEAVADTPKTNGRSLFVFEDELSVVLRKMRTENSTLGTFLLQAADGRPSLKLTTRRKPLVATYANIGFLAASTPEWLEQDMREEDIRGGLVNRFLWFYGTDKADQSVPTGASIGSLTEIREQLSWIVPGPARTAKEVKLSPEAYEYFDAWYKVWRGKPSISSLASAATARAPSHAIRLGMLYSLLDSPDCLISLEHIQAATAVSEYCAAVAQHLFLTAAHDRDAKNDRNILDVLKAAGRSAKNHPIPVALRDLHRGACPGMGGVGFLRLLNALESLRYIGLDRDKAIAWLKGG
jgi:hypothetical protein